MLQSGKAAKSVITLIGLGLVSKILGFIREALIAAKFGSDIESDAFFVALTGTTLFTTFLTQAIKTTMIPVLSEIESKEGIKGKNYHTNNLLNLMLIISMLIIFVGWFIAPFVVKFLAIGFKGEKYHLTVYLMRIGLPVVIFSVIVGVLRGYLQSEFMFNESAAADFPFNLVYIFYLILLSSIFGIKGLMIASVFAVLSQILIQIPVLRKVGYKYKLICNIKDKYVDRIIHLIPPVLLSVGINDLNTIIDKSLASTLIDGSISALNYGVRLKVMVLGVFITPIATVIFPMLSKETHKDNLNDFKQVFRYGFNTIVLITVPATIGMVALSEPIVRIAFQRGAFDERATYMTVGAMIFYSLGLVGTSLKLLMNRVYYSLQDTKTPMINGFITIAINIVLNLILIQFWDHRGLAFATSISSTLATGLLIYNLGKKIGDLGIINLIKCGLKALSSSLIMGVIIYFGYNRLEPFVYGNTILEFVTLLIMVIVGIIIYLCLISFLKVDEIKWFIPLIRKKKNVKQ